MRIISKFNDHYDSAAAYGVDLTVILKRVRKVVKTTTKDKHQLQPSYCTFGTNAKLYYEFNLLFFCGKLYPSVMLTIASPNKSISSGWCYDQEKLNKFLDTNALLISATSIYKLYKCTPKKNYWVFNTYQKLVEHLKRVDKSILENLTKYAYEYKVCYFNFNRVKASQETRYNSNVMQIEHYPDLKTIGFQRIKESFVTFQEIDMYLSGVLGVNDREIIITSDKTKRDAHGFDDKSFKTSSPGKKHRKKK